MEEEAVLFISKCYKELGKGECIEKRMKEITQQITSFGYYEHTYEEISHGAKMAWRNSNKCIGRLFWDTLHVIDARTNSKPSDIANSLFYHLESATNNGRIKPTLTVFQPKKSGEEQIRIWNHQLIRYAGYETSEGIIGDPLSIPFTKECEKLGWRGNRTNFDILPLVIETKEYGIHWFTIPEKYILEVDIEHPDYPSVKDLGLKWYAVPAIADMKLEIGGIEYTAAPFNGWYMGTEIGARNFADKDRYNMLPKIASLLNLDTSKNSNLWKDRALVELNRAVLYSYQKSGVSIVDHHTASEQFRKFEKNEKSSGRKVTGKWNWLIPPVSPATTHIFHEHYNDEWETPNFTYQMSPF
nr:nitric oxide synthase oxygenase [Evansella tamaricis]